MEPSPLDAVRSFVKAILRTFVEERIRRCPNNPFMLNLFQQGKAHLAISHHTCEDFLEMVLPKQDVLFGPVCAAVLNSPCRNMQRFFCTLQLVHAYQWHLVDPNGLTSWLYLVAEGACDIYGQPFELFARLQNSEQDWLRRESTSEGGMRALRFAHCAMIDLFRELQCGTPHINASIAVLQAFDEMYRGRTAELDGQGRINVGEILIASNWEPYEQAS